MSYEKNYRTPSTATVEQTERMTMSRVYGWMTAALVLSTVSALYTAQSEALLSLIFGSRIAFFGLFAVEIGLVWYVLARIAKLSFPVAASLLGLYSLLNGVLLSSILLVYAQSTVYTAFLATALTFGTMSLIGYTTKRDLTSMGSFLMMALVGLIIASVVNVFWSNSMMDTIITYGGLLIFIGLTAYDTQKIKVMLQHQDQLGIDIRNIALLGALNLYLDFVNLFLYILRLLGRRD